MLTVIVSACSQPETLGDIATNVVVNENYESSNTTKSLNKNKIVSINNQDNDNAQADQTQRKGFLSWLFGKSKHSKDDNTISDEGEIKVQKSGPKSIIVDNSTKKTSSKAVKTVDADIEVKLPESTPEQKLIIENKENIFKRMWNSIAKFNTCESTNDSKYYYKEDSLKIQNKLAMAVLRIPKADNLVNKEVKPNNKFLETKKTVQENIKDKNELYAGFNVLNFVDESNLLNNHGNKDQNIEEQYLDYIVTLKYEGIISNYNNVSPSLSLTNDHKKLINQLLQKDYNSPKILYVIYRNINTIKDHSSVKNQLYLTSYLNTIRAYIYGKKVSNVFVQEVRLKDLPVNEILLVTKPISFEQFQDLPKQVNIYNSHKSTSKAWLEQIKSLDQKAKERQKKLYSQAEGR